MTLLSRVLVAAMAMVILVLTLYPVAGRESGLISLDIVGLRGVADALANVLLFVPFGAAAALVMRGWKPVGAAVLLSLSIEVLQLAIPGRYTSPFDLMFNTAGAVIGVALVRSARHWLVPRPWAGGLLATASLVSALAVLGAGGLLFRSSIPTASLFGQWTAEFGNMEVYRGRVTAATVGQLDVPSHRIRETDQLRELLQDGAPIRVDAVAGPPTRGLAPLFSIFDAQRVEVLLIGVDGDDIVIRYRMRSTVLRLDEPHFRAVGVLRGVRPGDEITVEFRRAGVSSCLSVMRPDGGSSSCEFGYTVGDTWALLLFPVPQPLPSLLRVFWIAALLAPAGFWFRGTRALVVATALLAVVVLWAAPGLVGILPTPPVQLAAAVAGVSAGYLLGRWVDRLRSNACSAGATKDGFTAGGTRA